MKPGIRTSVGALLVAAAMTLAGAAGAAEQQAEIGQIAGGYTYYNRPGATLTAHNEAVRRCLADTYMPMQGFSYPVPGTASPFGPLAYDLIWSGPIAGLAAVRVENCMIVRGWRVVSLPEAEGAALAAEPVDRIAATLEPWIGAAQPHGTVVRTFNNEALHPAGYHTASRPRAPGKGQLSLRLASVETVGRTGAPSPADTPAPAQPVAPGPIDPAWPGTLTKLADLHATPPHSAIVLVRVSGISNRYGTGIVFAREPDRDAAGAYIDDHAPRAAGASIGFLFAKKEGNWFILVLPPGRWRLVWGDFVTYCLGAPAFDVAEGETVYAGAFAINSMDLTPDLNLEAPRAFLNAGGRDDLMSRLRPATYVNGVKGDCHGSTVSYALEFPGAPFVADYDWGSRARP